jgi:hypothetical protein
MNLAEFLDEVSPHPKAVEQLSYDVMIGRADDSDGDLDGIEEVYWDHNGGKVIIRPVYVDED